jgi:hypothetical protein
MFEETSAHRKLTLGIAVALLMAVTRLGHFGTSISLPDASVAAFFLAGALNSRRRVFALLCVEAYAIDGLAFALGTSTACVTKGYAFLVPTYALAWLGGRLATAPRELHVPRLLSALLVSTASAFVVSSGSYFVFSPSFSRVSVAAYATQASVYFVHYVATTAVYALAGLALARLFARAAVSRDAD